MDQALRNRLWDALTMVYWERPKRYAMSDNPSDVSELTQRLWHLYFKQPIDTIPDNWPDTHRTLRTHFFGSTWNEAYDFIEFIAKNHSWDNLNSKFIQLCNVILEQELSGFRFIGTKIAPITSTEEIHTIEQALTLGDSLAPVRSHLTAALDKLADRENPDYRNSIKESISAVEALCKLLTKSSKASFGDALKQIEAKTKLHPALKTAFSSLYGYTSDASGIRHALLDEPRVSFEDAKFMLVSCSAFVNFVVAKASKTEIKL